MTKFDLHIHTARHSPDSRIDPVRLVHRAREVGLDGVVITEHDWLWTEAELEELRRESDGLVVLAGIEVSTKDGHFLTYGVSDPFRCPRGIGVAELCEEVHRQGGVVVAAHPFRWNQPFEDILREEQPALDGLELMTSNMDARCRQRAAEVIRRYPLAGFGSSDAHNEQTVGFCYTVFDAVIRDRNDLVQAIRARKTTAHQRAG